MLKQALLGVLCAAVVLSIGILIGHFGISKSSSSEPSWMKDVVKDVDENLIKQFLSEVKTSELEQNLRWVQILIFLFG